VRRLFHQAESENPGRHEPVPGDEGRLGRTARSGNARILHGSPLICFWSGDLSLECVSNPFTVSSAGREAGIIVRRTISEHPHRFSGFSATPAPRIEGFDHETVHDHQNHASMQETEKY
jgi:hypothetical protein